MNQNQIVNDIKDGFNAMADGIKEASRKRTAELVAKNGYVAFKNPEAVAQFHADPYYANWSYTFVDGEYRFSPPKNNNNQLQENIQNELYDGRNMPLSNNPRIRQIQEKLIKGEELTIFEKTVGRDHPVKQLYGYNFKPNHVYRSIDMKAYKVYKEKGFVIGFSDNDEFILGENNLGVDWYLGGVDPKYGKGEVILECPAYKEYFTPSADNGCGMALDPTIRHMKSSGSKNPVPMSIVKVIKKPSLHQEISQEELNNNTFLQEPKILETYKEVIKDFTKTTFISVEVINNKPNKCKYELISIDKRTGTRKKEQETIVNFDGKFSMETLPSIYNQLADGFPAIDYEKENGIIIQNIDNSKVMGFGNLSPEQIQLVKDMKNYVDNKYLKQEQKVNEFKK